MDNNNSDVYGNDYTYHNTQEHICLLWKVTITSYGACIEEYWESTVHFDV